LADGYLGPRSLVAMQMEVSPAQNWALVKRARPLGARLLLNVAPADSCLSLSYRRSTGWCERDRGGP